MREKGNRRKDRRGGQASHSTKRLHHKEFTLSLMYSWDKGSTLNQQCPSDETTTSLSDSDIYRTADVTPLF